MGKFYKTRITVEVLSERPYDEEDLDAIAYDVCDGDCVGTVENLGSVELSESDMVDALEEAGSDSSFFGIGDVDDDYDDEEDDDDDLGEEPDGKNIDD